MAKVGQPGYGKSIAVRTGVEKLTPRYFELLEGYLNGMVKEDTKFAMSELGKLMGKMLPTEITGEGGNALMITWQTPQPSSQSNTSQETGQDNSTTQPNDGSFSYSTGEPEKPQPSSTTFNETVSESTNPSTPISDQPISSPSELLGTSPNESVETFPALNTTNQNLPLDTPTAQS